MINAICNYQLFLGCLFSFLVTTKEREYRGTEKVERKKGEEDQWKEEAEREWEQEKEKR